MDYPFLYLNHGPLAPESFDKVDSIWIGFARAVPPAARAAIQAGCPQALAGFYKWGDDLFYAETPGDVYMHLVADEFGGDGEGVSHAGAAAFSAAVEAWLREVHAAHPIAFAIGPGYPDDEDAWDRASRDRIGDTILPWLDRFMDANPDLPDEAEAEDDSGAAPMDRYFLGTILQHLEDERASDADRAHLAALAERMEGAGDAD